MKLSEALMMRSDIQKRVEQLRERLKVSVQVQDGTAPPEKPQTLLLESERLLGQLSGLIYRINRTNLSTNVNPEMTLTDALAQRDVLALRISMMKAVAEAASGRVLQYSRSGVRSVPTIDIASIRRQIDNLSKQYRELDTEIQRSNWMTDLIEI
jgi:hypothetical protein